MPIIVKKITGQSFGTPEMIKQLKNWLVNDAGWLVAMAGNSSGSLYNPSGDVANLTFGGWIVIKPPTGSRQILFHCAGGYGTSLSVYYSAAAGFGGGSATSRPTATDEKLFFNDHRYVVNDAHTMYLSADTSAPYGWFMRFFDSNAGSGGMFYDPLEADTHHADDPDPLVMYIPTKDEYPVFTVTSLTSSGHDTFPQGIVNGTKVNTPMTVYKQFDNTGAFVNVAPGGMSGAAEANDRWPIHYVAPGTSGNAGLKGRSSMLNWMGQARTDHSLSADKNYYYTAGGSLAVKWDGSTNL